jgi:hypothetical protein
LFPESVFLGSRTKMSAIGGAVIARRRDVAISDGDGSTPVPRETTPLTPPYNFPDTATTGLMLLFVDIHYVKSRRSEIGDGAVLEEGAGARVGARLGIGFRFGSF